MPLLPDGVARKAEKPSASTPEETMIAHIVIAVVVGVGIIVMSILGAVAGAKLDAAELDPDPEPICHASTQETIPADGRVIGVRRSYQYVFEEYYAPNYRPR